MKDVKEDLIRDQKQMERTKLNIYSYHKKLNKTRNKRLMESTEHRKLIKGKRIDKALIHIIGFKMKG